MKDYIKEIVNEKLTNQENINRIREYLQKYLLYILYKKKIYQNFVFTGGTALRFIFKLRRFSEDLDFCLAPRAKECDFHNILKIIKKEFIASNYRMEIKYSTERNVYNAFLKFPGLLFEYGLSPHREEKISVKIEIDTNPPSGGREDVTLYNSVFMFYIIHYEITSLFAGKVHALLCREYTKGRDWYDLLWYLTNFKNLEPNLAMLNNAIKQTAPHFFEITRENWRTELRKAIDNLDVERVRNDVLRFLEDPLEADLLTRENLYKMTRSVIPVKTGIQ